MGDFPYARDPKFSTLPLLNVVIVKMSDKAYNYLIPLNDSDC